MQNRPLIAADFASSNKAQVTISDLGQNPPSSCYDH